MRVDPIGLAGGLNLFQYANANPIRFKDPRGLEAFVDSGDWIGPGNNIFDGFTLSDGPKAPCPERQSCYTTAWKGFKKCQAAYSVLQGIIFASITIGSDGLALPQAYSVSGLIVSGGRAGCAATYYSRLKKCDSKVPCDSECQSSQ